MLWHIARETLYILNQSIIYTDYTNSCSVAPHEWISRQVCVFQVHMELCAAQHWSRLDTNKQDIQIKIA